MNLETKIAIYKFTPQVFTLTLGCPPFKKIDHIGAVRKKHPATKVESKGFLHYGKQVIFPDRY